VFDSVIVVTDRIVLDQQLQDTIYQFEHRQGVVQKIDESSKQLAESARKQRADYHYDFTKVSVCVAAIVEIAEARGGQGSGVLPTRRCAVIIDEAHSSQSGETATS